MEQIIYLSCDALLGRAAHQIIFLATTLDLDRLNAPLGLAELRKIDIGHRESNILKVSPINLKTLGLITNNKVTGPWRSAFHSAESLYGHAGAFLRYAILQTNNQILQFNSARSCCSV